MDAVDSVDNVDNVDNLAKDQKKTKGAMRLPLFVCSSQCVGQPRGLPLQDSCPQRPRRPCLQRSACGMACTSAAVKTGPSLQMYTEPTLQRPHLPTPHFMRFSSVV